MGYAWHFAPGTPIYIYGMSLESAVFRRNGDGIVETVKIGPSMVMQTWGLHQFTLSGQFQYENLDAPFSLPEDAFIPAGTYRFATSRLQYSAPQGALLRTTMSIQGGQFFDGHQTSFSVGPVWDPSAHLNLSANYQLDYVELPDRDQRFTSHVVRFRTQVMFSTQTSAIGFIQYSKTDNAIVANIRFRYNPREGNDLYIVWN